MCNHSIFPIPNLGRKISLLFKIKYHSLTNISDARSNSRKGNLTELNQVYLYGLLIIECGRYE
ncbi:hypothetical protein VIBNISFn27_940105 [Vibrio nigripulchritudo SFn27]|uniref:Uncharacterized protein n=1 Tax=Vibrio nigripulchritudo TaxID=28173 RepID=U4KBL2_9VIBR|nr:hypothetical protein VIBNIBLFn1_470105 [Vibrio nigripulchritudo BLFn1]CCN91438.1 hypothetical protein VIBNISFn27_940105 [Vibrio nigripulchritudo SFn27]CCN97602.1 hypothetical protein VIBNIENn2_990104 [Vibrio nigripulchritudo ENn2]CCO38745.1 hypothetical protein VIBNISFn135_1060105 [Vibrio nigripulchritudo SFn135]CCO55150.1 hypothetical protein VIBNIWn13_780106 [Vibrio nigripulchritudo Wn13]CCO60245.1 hypothetical protein VIBNI_B0431 [Vibrio nigripulchritudo]